VLVLKNVWLASQPDEVTFGLWFLTLRGREIKIKKCAISESVEGENDGTKAKSKEPGIYPALCEKRYRLSAATALASLPSAGKTRRAVEATSLTELSYARIASSVLSSGDGFRSV
jgi:hypothetical protein